MTKKLKITLEEDYKDKIRNFEAENVSFLLVGGIAVGLYGHPRLTKDLDLWVLANKENAPKIINALAKFGAPMNDISAEDFEKEGTVFQIGVEPILDCGLSAR